MPLKKRKKILVAMSGGVDSSVAAALLKRAGYDVAGVFLHFWKDPSASGAKAENKCCSAKALSDARRVAEKIGIPLYTLNFSAVFKEKIVDNFLSEYANGRTPNPCVRCNQFVKLGLLIKKARALGFDLVASGHYARLAGQESARRLARARDLKKDQSYFLYRLGARELKRLLFPLGGYTKEQVRALARKFKLPVAEKSDSQEICFIPDKSHNEFLKRNLKMKGGDIIDSFGKKVGQHAGLALYTLGQRRGVEIGGVGPYYVVGRDYKKNILYVSQDQADPKLFKKEFFISKTVWADKKQAFPLKCEAMIRYGHKGIQARVFKKQGGRYLVVLADAQRAITSGQSAVFYKSGKVLGGGVIV